MNRQELIAQIKEKQSFLCVGLDPDLNKIPQACRDYIRSKVSDDNSYISSTLLSFCAIIADKTAPYCVAYKPNLAFFEAYGIPGLQAYDALIKHLNKEHPHHLIIADAKRGAQVDALTVAPYMGEDSVTPFLGYEGKWVILLALTSNKGSHDFQLMEDAQGERLFEKVLKTSKQWGNDENMMYVVGATQGQMFEDIRKVVPNHFLLVPGVGAQGGSLEEVCKYGMIPGDVGLLVNSSRGIIYASNGADFADVAAEKAKELQEQMAKIMQNNF